MDQMADVCMTRSSVFSVIQGTAWLSWRRAQILLVSWRWTQTTESWDDLVSNHCGHCLSVSEVNFTVLHERQPKQSNSDCVCRLKSPLWRKQLGRQNKAPLYKYIFYTSRHLYIECMRKKHLEERDWEVPVVVIQPVSEGITVCWC